MESDVGFGLWNPCEEEFVLHEFFLAIFVLSNTIDCCET